MLVPIVKKTKFDANGGPLRIALSFDTLLLCTYELDLRGPGSNASVPPFPKSGDNANSEDDEYKLPPPAGSNNGRRAWIFINIMDQTGDGGSYQCFAVITQGGKKIDVLQTDKKQISGNLAQEMMVVQFVATGK